MVREVCRACEKQLGLLLDITVSRKSRGARRWHVVVCKDCWRAWEALLDQASVGTQPWLELPIAQRGKWFL